MKIALDYDETFTADPVLWKLFIDLCKQRGHDVKFVTFRDSRYGNEDICADAYDCSIDIVFTNGRQKQHVYEADVWIDDSPSTIVDYQSMIKACEGCEIMVMPFDYGYTCPSVDKLIDEAKDQIHDHIESVVLENNPHILSHDIPQSLKEHIKDVADALYDDLEDVFEGCRSINEEMREAADNQISYLEEQVEHLEAEVAEYE